MTLDDAQAFVPAHQQPVRDSVQQRLRCAEVMDALRRLEERVRESADDAGTGSQPGLGFRATRGALRRSVEAAGRGDFADNGAALALAHGRHFEPSRWLRDLAQRGQDLSAWRVDPPAMGDPPRQNSCRCAGRPARSRWCKSTAMKE